LTKKSDALFEAAVTAIDGGDLARLEDLLLQHPELVHQRLEEPGAWLRDKIGDALEGFFARPYLLWFVAEDPVRNDILPENICDVARTIIRAARREEVETLQEQVDYALTLVAWSSVAEKCGVQLELADVLADAGGSLVGVPEEALVNGHVAVARHLVDRGAPVTLASALLFDHWDDAVRLAGTAPLREKQRTFVLAALHGRSDVLSFLIRRGVDVSAPSEDLYSHATPLHHAVCSSSLEAVRVLVEAGADLSARDEAYHATPLGWAEYYRDGGSEGRSEAYAAIAGYLGSRAS